MPLVWSKFFPNVELTESFGTVSINSLALNEFGFQTTTRPVSGLSLFANLQSLFCCLFHGDSQDS